MRFSRSTAPYGSDGPFGENQHTLRRGGRGRHDSSHQAHTGSKKPRQQGTSSHSRCYQSHPPPIRRMRGPVIVVGRSHDLPDVVVCAWTPSTYSTALVIEVPDIERLHEGAQASPTVTAERVVRRAQTLIVLAAHPNYVCHPMRLRGRPIRLRNASAPRLPGRRLLRPVKTPLRLPPVVRERLCSDRGVAVSTERLSQRA